MQAAMQINSPSFSGQLNLNALSGNGMSSQPSRSPAFNSGGNPFGQMADMMSGFSKASFSFVGQHTGNGASSTFVAHGTIDKGAPAAGMRPVYQQYPQMPSRQFNDDLGMQGGCFGSNNTLDRCASASHAQTPPPPKDCGCKNAGGAGQTQWSNTEVSGNKASINLGDYKLDFNKADSSMLMTNTKTGDTTKIWGDPHIDQHVNGAGKTSAMFNGPMTFQLPDNTKVTIGTQAGANNKSVSYADQVTITRGNQAYQVTGLSEQNKAGLSVQKSRDGRALDAAAPDGYTLQAAADGRGWIDPTTGKQPTASDFRKATA